MRCFYLDPGLRDDVGHHANFCRNIVGALRRRGVETAVFGFAGIQPALAAECAAQPHFRAFAYHDSDGDPIAGWLNGFDLFMRATVEDFDRLPRIGAGDVVYLSTVRPVQLMAALMWYRRLPEAERPSVILEINETGMNGRRDGGRLVLEAPDPRDDHRTLLFRFIARCHLHPVPAGFHVASFDPTTAAAFAELTGTRVRTLALPFQAVGALRNRAGAAPVTLACLGHQRAIKGYHLLPEIARALLHRHRDLRLLIQVLHTGGAVCEAATVALHGIAAAEPRLMLDDQPAGGARWAGLLDRTDLMLCPYQPELYALSFSSMACEAAAHAIPMVVPAGTTLADLLASGGGAGITFEQPDAAAVLDAIEAALARFDDLADAAYRAALAWPETRGPDVLAAQIVALATGAA